MSVICLSVNLYPSTVRPLKPGSRYCSCTRDVRGGSPQNILRSAAEGDESVHKRCPAPVAQQEPIMYFFSSGSGSSRCLPCESLSGMEPTLKLESALG